MSLAAPHPDYREMHVYAEGEEMVRDFNMTFYPAGALFKDLFRKYMRVTVKHGADEYRLYKRTPVKEALEALGVPNGAVVQIYADHRAW
jgi:hypothetical protein